LYRTGPAVALLCLALALASCGGGGSSTAGTTAATTTPKPSAEVKAAAPTKPDPAGKTGHGCEARIGNFVDRMTDLRQALLAGLSYAEYVVRVRAIRDAYEAVPVDHLGVECLSGPAGAAEDAFNQYLRAANTWGECAGTEGCAASEIETKLQHRWHIASKRLDRVERG
jgi:hypothetical protein